MGRNSSDALLSIVIPLHNEQALLRHLLDNVCEQARSTGCRYEVVLVDDGSTDETWQIIADAATQSTELKGLRLSRNFGKEAALCAGLEHAQGDAAIIMDGDFQHPPELIAELVRIWMTEKVEIVEAVKRDAGQKSGYSSSTFYFLFSKLTGTDISQASDYKLLDRRVIDAWSSMPERSLFFRGMVAWLGFSKARVFFDVPERPGGTTSWTTPRLIGLAVTAITSFSATPLRLAGIAGVAFFVFALGLGIQTLYMKLSGRALDGFTTVILLILVASSITLISMGVMGEYMARIYAEVKRRPRYVVTEQIHRETDPSSRR